MSETKRAEWVEVPSESGTRHVLRVGPVSAWVLPEWDGHEPLWAFEADHGDAPDVDRAKELAENALREMHSTLNEHYAPVLRWERDLHSVAYLGPWMLEADSEEWSVKTGSVVVASGERCTTRENNRLAAEAALRALGVVFRTEGE